MEKNFFPKDFQKKKSQKRFPFARPPCRIRFFLTSLKKAHFGQPLVNLDWGRR